MKTTLIFLIIFLCFFSSTKAQNVTNLDSLEATLKNLSWNKLNSIGKKYRDNNEFKKSEIYLRKAIEVAENQNGKDSLYAISCEELGIVYYYQGILTKVEPLWQEAKEVRQKVLGENHYEYINSCNNLANVYQNQGQYDKAAPLFIEAIKLFEEAVGREHSRYTTYQNNLADVYFAQGKYQKAEPLYVEIRGKYAQEFGKKHPNYTKASYNLAVSYYRQKMYKEAVLLFFEVKENYAQTVGKQHPTYILTCNYLASSYELQGLYQKAEPLYLEVVEIKKQIVGEEHIEYAEVCVYLAILYFQQGLYEKAEPLFVKVKDIYFKKFGNQHTVYASACHNLATLYDEQGLYQKAESLYIEAKDIYLNKLRRSEKYADVCNNLAILYQNLGLYEKAKNHYREAQVIYLKLLGKQDKKYSVLLNNLANLYQIQKNYQKAEQLYLVSKNIEEELKGKQHLDYGSACNNLASLYYEQSLYKKAETLHLEAQNIYTETVGKNHPYYANSCNNLANLYNEQGLLEKAEKLHLQAKEIIEKTYGKQHPDYALYCRNLAQVYFSQNEYQKAESQYLEMTENKIAQIKTLFPIMSEEEKREYLSSIQYFFSKSNYFITQYYKQKPEISRELFNQQLFKKGILFSSTQKMKKQILNSGDSSLIHQYEDWRGQKEKYVKIIQTPIKDRDNNIDIKQMANQINDLEKEISKKSELFKQNTQTKKFTWSDVQEKLSKNEAVVEVIRLVEYTSKAKAIDTLYVALIISKETKDYPELLILENGKELENDALSLYQNSIEFQLEDNESYNQYWKPIQDKLDSLSSLSNQNSYAKIYFSPDGIYHKININTLLNPKKGTYLVEEQNIQLITSSRDLLKQKGEKNTYLSKNYNTYKAYLLGYPAYNLNPNTKSEGSGKDRSLNGLQRIVGQQTIVPVLEGTKTETNQIHELFSKNEIAVTLFQNTEATEENIKSLQNPTILHLATHGFFISEDTQSEKVTTVQEAEDRNLMKNPFLRSGLLLAGCQNPQIGEEDGILSAQEVMNLNLDKTELVVASACETGLGDIQSGEGVYGLQRAFRQAGAKTLIMSLWKVSDEATQLLMVTFYEEFLSGKSKREAFKIAQLKLKEKYSEPYYWGAFVMVGE
ncbi:CHAT domain-containing tetratricopeptide repeat protein [Bernardetia sp. ABR2-2B]|uniref:CHAT domain-containing protein n=1 Tax=Bernardetia sp. ABR2-2B TaxID=3127472 RepID=UPI0030D0F255